MSAINYDGALSGLTLTGKTMSTKGGTMGNELRYVGGGVYKSDYVTIAADMHDGGAFVATKTPDGTYVGATIPADILVAILESQGYIIARADETPEEAHIINEPARL